MLAVDTSSTVVSSALVQVSAAGVGVVARRDHDAGNRHGELLAGSIDDVLREGGVSPTSLGAVAAGLGPGPFTGLRVGVVTAATLADALGIPAYGACSLDAVAHAFSGRDEVVVCTDARRKQVYWARYDAGGQRVDGPDIATAADVARRFAREVPAAIGAGVRLYPSEFEAFAQTRDVPVSAVDVATLVAGRVRDGAPTERLEPMYLRRPDASPPGRRKSVLPQ